MDNLNRSKLQQYLSNHWNKKIEVVSISEIGKKEDTSLKSFGYGRPYLVQIRDSEGERKIVLESMASNHFGHEYPSDRAAILLWSYSAYNSLPDHVKALDTGAFCRTGELISLSNAEEYYLITEYVDGVVYAKDLEALSKKTEPSSLDIARATSLAAYLAKIHSVKRADPPLYHRRIRELLGHGECIMGIVDNYPVDDAIATPSRLEKIEQLCVRWRWKLKNKASRLCQVHGDYHPWNILFRENVDFTVLDRSRGEWGEAADDVSSMMMNYIFQSLAHFGDFRPPYTDLASAYWTEYMKLTDDSDLVFVIQPFFAWRSLVIANPVWYPTLKAQIRESLFRFMEEVLNAEKFEPEQISRYLGVS